MACDAPGLYSGSVFSRATLAGSWRRCLYQMRAPASLLANFTYATASSKCLVLGEIPWCQLPVWQSWVLKYGMPVTPQGNFPSPYRRFSSPIRVSGVTINTDFFGSKICGVASIGVTLYLRWGSWEKCISSIAFGLSLYTTKL